MASEFSPILKKDFEDIAANMEPDTLLRAMRVGLNAMSRALQRMEAQAIAASQPVAIQPAAREATRGSLARDRTFIRVRMTKSLRKYPQGYTFTGRDSQPWLPLTYWYEHGITPNRKRRGRDRHPRQQRSAWPAPAKSYGSLAAWAGAHVLAKPVDESQLQAIMEKELKKAMNRTFAKYGL